MRPIDREHWDRGDLVEKYSTYMFPYINLGVELDVTGLYRFAKEQGLSFYCAMIHTATKAALTVENFRYRLAEGEPMLCEKLDPIFVHLPRGSESFLSVQGEYREDILEFCRRNTEKMREAEETRAVRGRLSKAASPEILYITCLPWVKYTHIVRTIENPKTDTIPRLSWGKFGADEKGRLKMPFSVQVHHALMDGYHVCLYLQRLQQLLDQYG